MNRFFIFLSFFVLISYQTNYAQEDFELFLLDNFFEPDNPGIYKIAFTTSIECKSKIIIEDIGEFNISDALTISHQKEFDFSEKKISKKELKLTIICELGNSKIITNEENTLSVPVVFVPPKETLEQSYTLKTILGFFFWLTPTPGIQISNQKAYLTINKELSIVVFAPQSALRDNPYGYFSVEYNHIVSAKIKNLFRVGYKHNIEIGPPLSYISFGLTGFSNFNGVNGISPEISFTFFKIISSFDFFVRYRYDTNFEKNRYETHNIQFGFFTNLFSLNFNY